MLLIHSIVSMIDGNKFLVEIFKCLKLMLGWRGMYKGFLRLIIDCWSWRLPLIITRCWIFVVSRIFIVIILMDIVQLLVIWFVISPWIEITLVLLLWVIIDWYLSHSTSPLLLFVSSYWMFPHQRQSLISVIYNFDLILLPLWRWHWRSSAIVHLSWVLVYHFCMNLIVMSLPFRRLLIRNVSQDWALQIREVVINVYFLSFLRDKHWVKIPQYHVVRDYGRRWTSIGSLSSLSFMMRGYLVNNPER